MPIYKTVLTPYDIDFGFSWNLYFDPNTGGRIYRYGSPNQLAAFYNAPTRPADIPAYDNRLTVAVDIGFWDGYLDTSHFVLGARYPTVSYTQPGDNRCGAAILGSWNINKGNFIRAAALEEVEIDDNFMNVHHFDTSNVIHEYRRYRVTLDSIYYNGLMMHEIRVKDHVTGALVYALPTTVISNYTPNYSPNSGRIVMASIFDFALGSRGGGSYSNLHVYWSLGGEWVANP